MNDESVIGIHLYPIYDWCRLLMSLVGSDGEDDDVHALCASLMLLLLA